MLDQEAGSVPFELIGLAAGCYTRGKRDREAEGTRNRMRLRTRSGQTRQWGYSAAMAAKDARITYKERIRMTPYLYMYGKKKVYLSSGPSVAKLICI